MNEFGMSGDDLEQMYQEVILEASKHPHGKESFAPNAAVEQSADAAANVTVQASHEYCTPGESHQFNPTCGDEVTLAIEVTDGAIAAIGWEGHGCSISQSSASLLSQLIEGTTVSEARTLLDEFRAAMRSRGEIELDEDRFGDAIALNGVSRYVARVKCAMLPWVALEHALSQ